MNKRAANNARKERHNNNNVSTIATAEIPKVETEEVETEEVKTEEVKKALDASDEVKTEEVKTEEVKTEEVVKSADEILAEIAAIKAKRESLAKEKEAIRAELKKKREIEKALAALEAEKKALEEEESAEVTLEEEASDSAGILGKDYKVSQKAQDELMIAALKASGNTVERIGIAREYWKKHSAEFRAITKEKQQKAIMRRCINRLIASGIVEHEGTRLTLKLDKLEALKTAESK